MRLRSQERFEARPCLGKKALSTKDGTKLLWPRVARNFERQTLQTDPVTTCQHNSPAVSRLPDSSPRFDPIGHRSYSSMIRLTSSQEIDPSPRRNIGRLPACYFVCERNSGVRIRTQVCMSLDVTKRLCHLGGPRKERHVDFLGDLFE